MTELEARLATYGPEIDQSQHAKLFSHIIINVFIWQRYFAHSYWFLRGLVPIAHEYDKLLLMTCARRTGCAV